MAQRDKTPVDYAADDKAYYEADDVSDHNLDLKDGRGILSGTLYAYSAALFKLFTAAIRTAITPASGPFGCGEEDCARIAVNMWTEVFVSQQDIVLA